MFDDLCRLCCNPHCNNEGLEIFSKPTSRTDITLADMIEECTKIALNINDNLPVKICQECHYNLGMYYAFQKRCEHTNRLLHQRLSLLESEHNETDKRHSAHIANSSNSTLIYDSKIEIVSCPEEPVNEIQIKRDNTSKNQLREKLKRTNSKENLELIYDKDPKLKMCYLCGALVKHIHSHIKAHRDADKPKLKKYSCEKCGITYSRSNNLKIHLRTHLDVKPLKCSLCDKRFIVKRYLDRHMNVHTGSRPFKCQFCPKAFQTKYNLNTHVRVHTREKPFECQFCEQCFRQRAALNVHIRTHTDSSKT